MADYQAPVRGVNELVLEVADLERAEGFYAGKLGLPVVERWPKRDAIWVLAGATRIGLWLPQEGLEGSRGGEHVHVALEIDANDFDSHLAQLRGHGLDVAIHEFSGERASPEPSRSAYVRDPDGHLIEFWTARMSRYGS
jgi:catechol 2,3-dioxygenase-like lactoylglutathione lyase family enzyme